MKKLVLFLSFILPFALFAKQVDEQTARTIGLHFIAYKSNATALKDNTSLTLVYKAVQTVEIDGKPNVYYYVFNVNGGKGFVIVSGDDAVKPILGYSSESGFEPNKMPPQVAEWMESYRNQIAYAVENKLEPTPAVKTKWEELTLIKSQAMFKSGGVAPLLKTKWDQSPYYNDTCPYDKVYSQRTVTGCVATAMAQVMKYWGYPAKGSGFHSYKHSTYGTLSADFANTTYNWKAMPNQVTSTDKNVARLMYQCGVSVDMNYGVGSTGGSSAYVISAGLSANANCAEYALKTYFKYDNTLKGIQRKNYTDAKWKSTMETQLDSSWPVIYAGFGGGGGHCFVCDGYDNNDYLHMNWGWSGYYNGYFEIDSLNPTGTGTGGGSGGYNSGQQAVIGIKGVTSSTSGSDSIVLDKDLVTDKASYIYGGAITVSTDVKNTGKKDFTGYLCVAIFDNTNSFVDYLEIDSNITIKAGKTYAYKIKDSSYSILPGDYTLYAYYRVKGGNWDVLNPLTNLVNYYANISVTNGSYLEMYTNDSISPTTFTQGQAASAYLNVANWGPIRFKGRLYVGLFNLDGTPADSIQTEHPNAYLPAYYPKLYIFGSLLKFSTPKINAKPGTYLLAAEYNYDSAALHPYWYLVGSTYHQNPIKVNVQAAPLKPDVYEKDDTISSAYQMTVNFGGSSSAASNTTGSNIHVGSDVDYYKVVLPTGYNYTISANLKTASNNPAFTLNAIFSSSVNTGNTWAGPFTDSLSSRIKLINGGTAYFKVAPYFSGNTGTYELDLFITRTIKTGIENSADLNTIAVYPNPVRDVMNIDLNGYTGKIDNISLYNIQGQKVYEMANIPGHQTVNIQTDKLPKGIYILKALSGTEQTTRQVVIE